MPYDPQFIPMRELERLSGVPRATILYYIKEGLLPEPRKTARNMAYYDRRFVEGLELIRDLRERHNLTLQQTKQVLKLEYGGLDIGLLLEVRDRVFHQIAANPELPPLTWEQLLAESNLEQQILQRLDDMRLLFPLPHRKDEQGHALYHRDSLIIAKIFKRINDMGIPFEALTPAAENLARLARLEVDAFLQYVAKPMAERGDSSDSIWAATHLSIEMAQSIVALFHLHSLYRLILTPEWPRQIAKKALAHLQHSVLEQDQASLANR